MKSIAIALLIWLTLVISGSADGDGGISSTGKNEYHLIALDAKFRDEMRQKAGWKVCGDYFIATKIPGERVVHFTFGEEAAANPSRTFAFTMTSEVSPIKSDKAATPLVMIWGKEPDSKFLLAMNKKDYDASLPCLVGGTDL